MPEQSPEINDQRKLLGPQHPLGPEVARQQSSYEANLAHHERLGPVYRRVAIGQPDAAGNVRVGLLYGKTGQSYRLMENKYHGLHRGTSDRSIIHARAGDYLIQQGLVIDVERSVRDKRIWYLDTSRVDRHKLSITVGQPATLGGLTTESPVDYMLTETGQVEKQGSDTLTGPDSFAAADIRLRGSIENFDDKFQALLASL